MHVYFYVFSNEDTYKSFASYDCSINEVHRINKSFKIESLDELNETTTFRIGEEINE